MGTSVLGADVGFSVGAAVGLFVSPANVGLGVGFTLGTEVGVPVDGEEVGL